MQSQHERIEIVTDDHVKLKSNGCGWIVNLRKEGCEGELQFSDGRFVADDAGLEALQLAISCYRQTGSFAGLRTDNAIPWPGKRVRCDIGTEVPVVEEVMISAISETEFAISHNGIVELFDNKLTTLLPLVLPQPKYRPYTPKEAVEHLGREFVLTHEPATYKVAGVCKKGFDAPPAVDVLDYEWLKFNATWADTGEPCGVLID